VIISFFFFFFFYPWPGFYLNILVNCWLVGIKMPMSITYCRGGSRNFSIVGIKLIFEDLPHNSFNFGVPKHRIVLPPCICLCFILY
jgi:hypothetical protein